MWDIVNINVTLRELLDINRKILAEVKQIRQLLTQPLTNSIAVQFTGATMQPNNTCVLNVGQTSQASILPLLADGITPSGGVVSNVAYNFNDPSATVVLNSDGVTATVTGVAASSGPVIGTATCTVTDTDSVVSQWTQSFTIQVNQVQQQQLTQSVAVQFSDPSGSAAPGTQSAKLSAPGVRGANEVSKPEKELNA